MRDNRATMGSTRRDFLAGAGAVAIGTLLRPAMARETGRAGGGLRARLAEGIVDGMRRQAATATITTQALRGNISVLLGSGGNIAVLTGPDGKLLIDAGLATSQPNLKRALDAVSNDPIKRLVNTHWHFDHTDGNAWLHGEGAALTAHENTLRRLSSDTRVEDWGFTFPAAPDSARPTETLATEKALHLNGETVTLTCLPPSHTDTDLVVHFREADVLHTGDIFWNNAYPFIDRSTGGSIDGTIRSLEGQLARIGDKTIVIPGHGPVGDKAQMADFRDMLVAVRKAVAKHKKMGMTLKETQAEKPTASFDARYGKFVIDPDFFVAIVYQGV